jgi:hypothetical protein
MRAYGIARNEDRHPNRNNGGTGEPLFIRLDDTAGNILVTCGVVNHYIKRWHALSHCQPPSPLLIRVSKHLPYRRNGSTKDAATKSDR